MTFAWDAPFLLPPSLPFPAKPGSVSSTPVGAFSRWHGRVRSSRRAGWSSIRESSCRRGGPSVVSLVGIAVESFELAPGLARAILTGRFGTPKGALETRGGNRRVALTAERKTAL